MSGFAPSSFTWFNNGQVAAGGSVNVYQTGTTTPVTIYSDGGLTTPISNPLTLDANGQCFFYVASGTNLRLDGFTASGGFIRTLDPVYLSGSGSGVPNGTYGDIVVSNNGLTWTIGAGVVFNTKLANMPANTIKGNNTAGSATPIDLSAAQATALLSPVVGDTGTGGTQGLVPAPGAGDAAAGKVLGAGGLFVPGTNLTLISTNTPASVANLVISTGFDSTKYIGYRFTIQNWRPVTANTTGAFSLSINGGSSYIANSAAAGWQCDGTTLAAVSTVDTFGYGGFTNSAGFASYCQIDIMQNNITTSNPIVTVQGGNTKNGTGYVSYYYSEVGNSTGSAINAIKFAPSSGNITSAVITMYGLR